MDMARRPLSTLDIVAIIGWALVPLMIISYWVWCMTDPTPNKPSFSVAVQECQYPGRYNPDGTCDNTDPCDPESIKDPILEGRCNGGHSMPKPNEQRPVELPEPERGYYDQVGNYYNPDGSVIEPVTTGPVLEYEESYTTPTYYADEIIGK